MKREKNVYASVCWTPGDVQTLRPAWTLEKAEEWLIANQKDLQEGTIQAGWEIMENLLLKSRLF